MINRRKNEGITLIALIITIIIMIILAAVTISLALNGGLFDQASEATKQMDIAQAREGIQTEVMGKITEKRGNITESEIISILVDYTSSYTGQVKIEDDIIIFPEKLYTIKGNEFELEDMAIWSIATAKASIKAQKISEGWGGNIAVEYRIPMEIVQKVVAEEIGIQVDSDEELAVEVINYYDGTSFTSIDDVIEDAYILSGWFSTEEELVDDFNDKSGTLFTVEEFKSYFIKRGIIVFAEREDLFAIDIYKAGSIISWPEDYGINEYNLDDFSEEVIIDYKFVMHSPGTYTFKGTFGNTIESNPVVLVEEDIPKQN